MVIYPLVLEILLKHSLLEEPPASPSEEQKNHFLAKVFSNRISREFLVFHLTSTLLDSLRHLAASLPILFPNKDDHCSTCFIKSISSNPFLLAVLTLATDFKKPDSPTFQSASPCPYTLPPLPLPLQFTSTPLLSQNKHINDFLQQIQTNDAAIQALQTKQNQLYRSLAVQRLNAGRLPCLLCTYTAPDHDAWSEHASSHKRQSDSPLSSPKRLAK